MEPGTLLLIIILVLCALAWMGLSGSSSEQKKRDAETEKYSDTLLPLRGYTSGYNGLDRCIAWQRANGDPDTPPFTVGILLMMDIVTLIRRIALPHDRIRYQDAELLSAVCRLYPVDATDTMSISDFITFIEARRPEEGLAGFPGLQLVYSVDLEEAQDLAEVYLHIADTIAGIPGFQSDVRATGLKEVHGILEIVLAAKTQEELLEDARRVIRESSATLIEGLEVELDAPFALFGTNREATDEEIKTAYHSSVALWHPDRLEGMAPELQEAATQKLTEINLAYKSILSEREDRHNA